MASYGILRFQAWMLMSDEEHDLLVGMLQAIANGSVRGFTKGERQTARRVASLLTRLEPT